MLTPKMISRAAPSQGANVDLTGTWTNQLGSTMVLATSGQSLTGRYRSAVSGGGSTVDGELVGYTDGDLASFVVNWTTPASLTAWTGQLVDENGRQVLKTLWHLVQNVPDPNEASGMWKATLAGTDDFWRV